MHSPDFTVASIILSGDVFPNCITETRDAKDAPKATINSDLLRVESSSDIVDVPPRTLFPYLQTVI